MPVEISLREYQNQFRTERPDWLIGNTGDWQIGTFVCDFAVEKKFSQGEPLMFDENQLILPEGSSWWEYGFVAGEDFTLEFDINSDSAPTSSLSITRTANLIQGGTLTYSGGDLGLTTENVFPVTLAGLSINNVIVWQDIRPQGAEILYNHMKNSQINAVSMNSFIDGSTTRFHAMDMDTVGIGVFTPMLPIGFQSGMSIRSAQYVYYGKIGTRTYRYAYLFEFMISSFFNDVDDFENLDSPAETLDDECLTDNIHIKGYPVWNNPNIVIENDRQQTKQLGNTGWLGENFNGIDNDFTVLGVTLEEVTSGETVDTLSYGNDIKIIATIGGVQNLLDGVTVNSLGFAWLPEDESVYRELNTPFHQNLKMNTCSGFFNGVFPLGNTVDPTVYQGFSNDGVTRMDVKDIRYQEVGGDVVFEAVFSPTVEFKNYIDSLTEVERKYVVWVSVADRTLETNDSNRVNLILSTGTMELFVPPIGEYSPMEQGFIGHVGEPEDAIDVCNTEFLVEDDILAKTVFSVDITGDIPNGIEFAIEMEKISDGSKLTLESQFVDLSQFPLDNSGVPQWDYEGSRGFKYHPDNDKNWVKVERNNTIDSGNSYGYNAFYGFKIRWEDWIAKTGVPTDFFDINELNNGFHNDWIHYFETLGWKLQFTVYTHVVIDGQAQKYVNEKEFAIVDYDKNDDLKSTWQFYRDSDNTNITISPDPITGQPLGVFIEDEYTRIEVLWTKTSGPFGLVDDFYGIIGVEVDQGGGVFDYREISTIEPQEGSNPLKPLDGEDFLKISLASPNVIKLECLVETSSLLSASRYKLTSRIGCK